MAFYAERTCTCQSDYCRHHRALRTALEPSVVAGEWDCWRCGFPIPAGVRWDEWDLGHDDHDRSVYRGPEHTSCNRATHRRGAATTPHRWVV